MAQTSQISLQVQADFVIAMTSIPQIHHGIGQFLIVADGLGFLKHERKLKNCQKVDFIELEAIALDGSDQADRGS
jgi:hypothetical protein